jgi:hypothetical protein
MKRKKKKRKDTAYLWHTYLKGIKERIKLAIKSNDKFECPFCPNEYDTLLKLTQHVQHRCDVVKGNPLVKPAY